MISIVLPCYNENETLDELQRRINLAGQAWNEPFEVILVDDGSQESTWLKIVSLCDSDPRWRAIRFSRNFGHQTAVSAGIANAIGDAVVVMDSDLQDPPEVVSNFIEHWREGYQVVYGVRRKRKEGWFKRASYFTFYRLLANLAERDIPLDAGDFCLMDRCVVDTLNQMPERKRFVRGLRAWAGFRQIGVAYERHARAGGEPKYSIRDLFALAFDGLLAFSTKPLRMASYFGLLVSSVAFLGVIFTLVQRIFAESFGAIGLPPAPGFATIVISILFLGGVQLISLGVLGEYIGRIYEEIKGRPKWVIQETVGAQEQQRRIAA